MPSMDEKRTIKAVKYRTRLDLLSSEQVDSIHRASLHILEQVGIKMPHPKVLDLMAEAGAGVDREKGKVYFPPALVENALKIAKWILANHRPEPLEDKLQEEIRQIISAY